MITTAKEKNWPRRIEKRWEICAPPGGVDNGMRELGISPLAVRILHNRGICSLDQAREFLSPSLADLPDPFTMKDMDKAVARLGGAIRNREKIILFGDYDVDGITATSLLLLFLRQLGGTVDFYLPHRVQEGYGLNLDSVKKILAGGAQLMITTDCGITNRQEIHWASQNGLEIIVTDHHEVPQALPSALAILNPKQKDCSYPLKGLAGVGVAFNLAMALRTTLRQEGFFGDKEIPNLKEYLDLVALGTVSDVVPLCGANRILVKYGLSQLTKSPRPGIASLREISGTAAEPVDTTAIHFRLAPRLNAAGRLEHARKAVHLLISTDPEEARRIALELDQLNSLRQRLEENILTQAKEMIGATADGPLRESTKKSIVLASEDWHPGVIGIVASRLTEEYNRPAILIALKENLGKGSGRSIDTFPLYQGLEACKIWVEKFGGHAQAAGLVIRRECIPQFSRSFEEVVGASLKEEDCIPRLYIDALTGLGKINESFLSELESLSPFGPGNPEPVLGVEGLRVEDSKIVGKAHLRLLLREGRTVRDAIGFKMAGCHPFPQGPIHMAFTPQIHFFQGRRTLELRIIDFRPPSPGGFAHETP